MIMRRQTVKRLAGASAGLLILAAAGIAGTLLSSGCVKVTEPDDGVAWLRIEPAATNVAPGGSLAIVVTATDKNGDPAKDGTEITFSYDTLGTISPKTAAMAGGRATATFTAGTAQGTSTITAAVGPVRQTTTVTIVSAPPPPGNVGDEIPISQVTWHHTSPEEFRVTAKLSNIQISGLTISWTWSQPGWPTRFTNNGVLGNMWVFARIDGRWHAATWEWLRSSTNRVTLEALAGQPPFIQASDGTISAWYPKHGEKIGFMASTICRSGIPRGSPNERSPIRLTTWP
ncbi:MAG TPA: invasin domain 3-containing protein [Candidatus Methanoperedens sp.]|nr:invasin domain 3-containing protein [Candidatus Methanoperedens sp.]